MSNTSLIFLCVLIMFFNPSIQQTEICAAANPSTSYSQILSIPFGQTYTFTQTACLQYFNITSAPTATSGYFLFEVDFQNLPSSGNFRPLVGFGISSTPGLYFDSDGSMYNTLNGLAYNSFMQKKSKHYIVQELSQFSISNFTMSIYKYFTQLSSYSNPSLTYTIQTSYQAAFPCPTNSYSCQNNFYCDVTTNSPKCTCLSGSNNIFTQFGILGCEFTDQEIFTNKPVQSSVLSLNWVFFEYNPTQADSAYDVQLTITKTSSTSNAIEIFLSYNTISNLPTFLAFDSIYPVNSSSTQQVIVLKSADLKASIAVQSTLYISVFNEAASSTSITVSLQPITPSGTTASSSGSGTASTSSSTSSTGYSITSSGSNANANTATTDSSVARNAILFSLIGIAVVLLAVWIILSILRRKYQRRVNVIHVQQIEQIPQMPPQPQYLQKADLDRYSPCKKFSNAKSSFPQTTCSICLEDFEPSTICRQLYCEHAFHHSCIETWLASKDKCPNCNKEMTHAAIQRSLRSAPNPDVSINEDQHFRMNESGVYMQPYNGRFGTLNDSMAQPNPYGQPLYPVPVANNYQTYGMNNFDNSIMSNQFGQSTAYLNGMNNYGNYNNPMAPISQFAQGNIITNRFNSVRRPGRPLRSGPLNNGNSQMVVEYEDESEGLNSNLPAATYIYARPQRVYQAGYY